jgi:RNA polymerase sigma factor (sigma-70 family)
LTRVYDRFSPLVVGYLRLQGAVEPEDLTSEVFLGVFRNLSSFTGDEAGFRSWLLTITHRRLQDERRRLGRRPDTVEFDAASHSAARGDVEQEALAELGTDRVCELLQTLSADQRTVLLLRIVGDFSLEQVATAMGKRPGAVKQLQRRGLNGLRRHLERQDVTL